MGAGRLIAVGLVLTLVVALFVALALPVVEVEAQKPPAPPRRLPAVAWSDEASIVFEGVEITKFKLYVDDKGRDSYRLASANETHAVFQSQRGRGLIVFEKLSDGRWKFNAYINATENSAVLAIEVGFSGHARHSGRRLAVINTAVLAGEVFDFTDANATIVSQGNKYLIQVPLRQGLNTIDPVIETYTYMRLVPPAQVQPGDVLAPHLYDWYFDGVDDYLVVGVQPDGSGAPFTVYGWTGLTVVQRILYVSFCKWCKPNMYGDCWQSPYASFDLIGELYNNVVAPRLDFITYNPSTNTKNTVEVWLTSIMNSFGDVVFNYDNTTRYYNVYVNARILANRTVSSGFITVLDVDPAAASRPNTYRRFVLGCNTFFRECGSLYQSYAMFFSRALSDSEITALYDNRVVNATGLRLFIDATFFDGARYLDLSGFGNHGVPYNGVSRVPANQTWLWLVRGNYTDSLVRLRFFPNTTIIRFSNGDALELGNYTSNSAGLVEYLEIDRTDIQDILIPDARNTLYTGYPENPETVYANADTAFGVLVSHNINVSRVNTVKMKIGDVVFAWNRDAGFTEERDPRNVARLDTVNSYVLYYNETHMAVYYVFRLDWGFDVEQGHKWHGVTFEAFSDDSYYVLMPVYEAFQFVDTLTAVDLYAPTAYSPGFAEIRGRIVYTGTDAQPVDWYGVRVCLEDTGVYCYDPAIANGWFRVNHWFRDPGNYTLRVYVKAPDNEIGFNNNIDVSVQSQTELSVSSVQSLLQLALPLAAMLVVLGVVITWLKKLR